MTRLATKYNAINLAQGFADFSCPEELKQAASRAIYEDYNQYSVTWGSPVLREAIAAKEKQYNRIDADPEKNIVVTCGTTEAMVASQIALLDPGDEIIIFSPHYENYAPDAVISGAKPKYFELKEEDGFSIDEEKLKRAFNAKTRGLVVNTPNNPTGKIYTKKELKFLADLCNDYDAICFTDEIYEHILYDGNEHISIGSLSSMRNRTVTISGFSKTYSVTGWRVGYTVAEEKLSDAIKKVHDFLTVGAPHPLQIACAQALALPETYYRNLRQEYQSKRDLLFSSLERIGFRCIKPKGAYYIWCDYSGIDSHSDDLMFATNLVKKNGVAGVPGSSFYGRNSSSGNKRIRFTFSKKIGTLEEACLRLEGSLSKKAQAPM
ncbi:MAG: pyridoxal phosphate-dependent aminotransferase [archaeon]|nr:pyridoxal phosphate-dependent aminotransferase [archaeon]